MDDRPAGSSDRPHDASLLRRVAQLLLSQLVLGLGVALLLDAGLGSDGFSMFVNGARLALDVEFVVVNSALSLVLIAFAWWRGRRPGVGTVTHAVIVGTTVSLLLPVLPGPETVALQWAELVGAFVTLCIGVAAYVAVDLGAGPLEAAALSLDPPVRFGLAYSVLQVTGAIAGWVMGADLGAGTVLVVLLVGPVVERLVPRFVPGRRGGRGPDASIGTMLAPPTREVDMSRVRVHNLTISLDGFGSGEPQTVDEPFGHGGHIMDWLKVTRTFHGMIGDPAGGETGVDDDFASRWADGIGVEIMGRGKYAPGTGPWPDEWRGWWGEEPPFHTPCVVLTHHPREPLTLGETTFHFVDASPVDALARARELAPGTDVRLGGGVTTVREFLEAGLVDYLHLVVAPVLLGRGSQLWAEGLEGLERRFDDVRVTSAPSGMTHVEFERG